MTETEEAQFETRYFADDVLFEQLTLAQAELLDSYARGHLTETECALAEKHFSLSPAPHTELAFAQGLRQVLNETTKEQITATSSPASLPVTSQPSQAWWKEWLIPSPSLGWAAIALLLLSGVAWQWRVNQHLRRELIGLQTRQTEQTRQAESLQQQLTALRSAQTNSVNPPAPPPSLTVPKPTFSPTTPRLLDESYMALQPTTRRSGVAENAPLIDLKPNAPSLTLELGLNFTPQPRSCSAVLYDSNDNAIAHAERLPVRERKQRLAVLWQIPTSQLKPGAYQIKASGYNAAQNEPVVLTYAFRVERH